MKENKVIGFSNSSISNCVGNVCLNYYSYNKTLAYIEGLLLLKQKNVLYDFSDFKEVQL